MAKNDRIDAHKIAVLLRGGMLPQAHVYPKHKRATLGLAPTPHPQRVRKRAELLAHLQNTSWQYRLEPLGRRVSNRKGRQSIAELFSEEAVRASIEADLDLIGYYDGVIRSLEKRITRTARIDEAETYDLIRSIPGVGEVLTLVFLYEIDEISRFETAQQFVSYCCLIRPPKTSAGKPAGLASNKKAGNAHLKWAFSEATLLLIRESNLVKKRLEKLTARHGKGKALGVLGHKLGRTLYYMLRRRERFDLEAFLKTG